MTIEKKKLLGAIKDIVRINAFCLTYMTVVIALRWILALAAVPQTMHTVFNVVAELCFVAGFIAVLPRVSVGGRKFIRTFRYKWEPYLALIIYGLFYLFIAYLFKTFHEPFWEGKQYDHSNLSGGLFLLGMVYFFSMFIPLCFCRLPRVLIARTALSPFSFIIAADLLFLGVFLLVAGRGLGLGGLANYICLFLYITLSISAGLKRPHRKRLRK